MIVHDRKDSTTEDLHLQFQKAMRVLKNKYNIRLNVFSFHGKLTPKLKKLLKFDTEKGIKFIDLYMNIHEDYTGKSTPQIITSWVRKKLIKKYIEQKPMRDVNHFVEVMKKKFKASFKHAPREYSIYILYVPPLTEQCKEYKEEFELAQEIYEILAFVRDKEYYYTNSGELEMLLKAIWQKERGERDMADIVDKEINKKRVFSDWFSVGFWLKNLTSLFQSVTGLKEKYCLESKDENCKLYADSLYNYDLQYDKEKDQLNVQFKDPKHMKEVKYKESIRNEIYMSQENKLKVEIMDYLFNPDPKISARAHDLVRKKLFSSLFSGKKKSEKKCQVGLFQVYHIRNDMKNRFLVNGKIFDHNIKKIQKQIKDFIISERRRFFCFGSSSYNNSYHHLIKISGLLLLTYDSEDFDSRNRTFQIFSDILRKYERRFNLVLLDKRDFISYFIRKKLRLEENEDLLFQKYNTTYSYVMNFNLLDNQYFFREKKIDDLIEFEGEKPEDGNDFYWEQILTEEDDEKRMLEFLPELDGFDFDFEENIVNKEIRLTQNDNEITITNKIEKGETKIQLQEKINLKKIRDQKGIDSKMKKKRSERNMGSKQSNELLEAIDLDEIKSIDLLDDPMLINHENKYVKSIYDDEEFIDEDVDELSIPRWKKKYTITSSLLFDFVFNAERHRFKMRFMNESIDEESRFNENIKKVNSVELEHILTNYKGDSIVLLHTEFPSSLIMRIETFINKKASKLKNTQILK
jgi:hypothetical protein